MNAVSRRAEIIRILRGRKKDKVKNLAAELGVNERTIRRDLLVLTVDEGYHIDTLQGNGGGVMFRGHNNPHKGILSQEQRNVLAELAQDVGGHKAQILHEILAAYA